MKVAILGAPGAGKTKLARAIVRRLNTADAQWTTIDGYVEKLRKRTGLQFAEHADFPHTFQVVSERWTLENEAEHKNLHTITCGSIYESIIYATARASWLPVQEGDIIEDRVYAQIMMHALGALEQRNFDYDALFFLPHPKPNPDSWDSVIDTKLPEVLEGFYKFAATLGGTQRQKVDSATALIQRIQAAATASTDEQ